MRIGLFTDTYTPEINGVVSSVTMLAEGLTARGHEAWVIAPSHPDAPADEDRVLRVASLPLVLLPERRFATPVEIGIEHTIKHLKFAIIHTNAEFAVNSFGFRAHRKFGIPHIHTYHTVWEDYTHYFARGILTTPAKAATRRFSAEICDRADRVIAPTLKTADLLRSYGVVTPIEVIPTGVDLARFSPADPNDAAQASRLAQLRKHLGCDRFELTLLALGRVAPEKSILELLLHLAPFLRDHAPDENGDGGIGLMIVGGGPQLDELRKLAPQLGIGDQVKFTGPVLWEHVPDYYRISDVLVGNSSTETQGLTFIEALASGVPIVVRYNSCFDGIITDGVSGALITDDDQFVPALNHVIAEPGRSERIRAGLAVARRMSKETFAQTVEKAYEDTLAAVRE
ncbi:MAG: glycosyltransferase [Actinomycetes bacterium]|jgi:1,2-diacylglycerol 3-alpha-glucosyltransferase|nr:glycosyltransferase [Actinomycetes bacterium]